MVSRLSGVLRVEADALGAALGCQALTSALREKEARGRPVSMSIPVKMPLAPFSVVGLETATSRRRWREGAKAK